MCGRAAVARANFVPVLALVVHRQAMSIVSSTLAAMAVAYRGRAWGLQLPAARWRAAQQPNSCTSMPAVVRVPAVDRALVIWPATFRESDPAPAEAVSNCAPATTFDQGRVVEANNFDRATTLVRADRDKVVAVNS
jgi:hypothetical protein